MLRSMRRGCNCRQWRVRRGALVSMECRIGRHHAAEQEPRGHSSPDRPAEQSAWLKAPCSGFCSTEPWPRYPAQKLNRHVSDLLGSWPRWLPPPRSSGRPPAGGCAAGQSCPPQAPAPPPHRPPARDGMASICDAGIYDTKMRVSRGQPCARRLRTCGQVRCCAGGCRARGGCATIRERAALAASGNTPAPTPRGIPTALKAHTHTHTSLKRHWMSGSSSGCSSAAYSTGAVASPLRRSFSCGLPISLAAGRGCVG